MFPLTPMIDLYVKALLAFIVLVIILIPLAFWEAKTLRKTYNTSLFSITSTLTITLILLIFLFLVILMTSSMLKSVSYPHLPP